mmetsp:Transcript_11255/g.69503  ORF Transcript_11255/g.69503 Transcript_11255/m.69503 type:complete len:284 (+) Transcript_11255:1354-2205(+)
MHVIACGCSGMAKGQDWKTIHAPAGVPTLSVQQVNEEETQFSMHGPVAERAGGRTKPEYLQSSPMAEFASNAQWSRWQVQEISERREGMLQQTHRCVWVCAKLQWFTPFGCRHNLSPGAHPVPATNLCTSVSASSGCTDQSVCQGCAAPTAMTIWCMSLRSTIRLPSLECLSGLSTHSRMTFRSSSFGCGSRSNHSLATDTWQSISTHPTGDWNSKSSPSTSLFCNKASFKRCPALALTVCRCPLASNTVNSTIVSYTFGVVPGAGGGAGWIPYAMPRTRAHV